MSYVSLDAAIKDICGIHRTVTAKQYVSGMISISESWEKGDYEVD